MEDTNAYFCFNCDDLKNFYFENGTYYCSCCGTNQIK